VVVVTSVDVKVVVSKTVVTVVGTTSVLKTVDVRVIVPRLIVVAAPPRVFVL